MFKFNLSHSLVRDNRQNCPWNPMQHWNDTSLIIRLSSKFQRHEIRLTVGRTFVKILLVVTGIPFFSMVCLDNSEIKVATGWGRTFQSHWQRLLWLKLPPQKEWMSRTLPVPFQQNSMRPTAADSLVSRIKHQLHYFKPSTFSCSRVFSLFISEQQTNSVTCSVTKASKQEHWNTLWIFLLQLGSANW